MKKILITVISIISFSAFGYGQSRMNLDSILNKIAVNHPVAKMYDANIRASDEAAKGARSWMAPEIGTGLYMVPYNVGLWKRDPSGASGAGQYMISVQQMIANKSELDANAKYMAAVSVYDREAKKASLNELYAAAKKSYYAWILLDKKLKVIDESETALNFMIQSAEIRYKNSLGKINAYYKAKAAVGNLGNQRIMLKNEIQQRKILLNTLMNRDKNENFEIDPEYRLKDYNKVDSSYFSEHRSDIKAIDGNFRLAGLQQNLERTKLKPQFGFRYDHMFGFGGVPGQYTLMAMVKLPIAGWSSKQYKANIESLKWKMEGYQAQKQMMLNDASGQSEGLMVAITNKKQQVALYEGNIVPALKKNFQTTQLSYEQNTGDLFELFDAWDTLNKTQLEYFEQLQSLLDMQAELDRVLEQK
ncbi:TolC family protein [Flavobacterium aquidurense]|uniref:Outer membrane protein TolC n=2 Tax=Flavobacterium TaxID=237 RepID=A0A7W7IW79_9FLAO|nr:MULTISPECIES: TolC family protein [Flavobacterium]MBB4801728.1 outer membrane protein TolC [Flavobacterium nitrogenifigens]MBB6386686.1 outer membrane protein TolC [Flavobacterium notoginsengisoli]